jgi:hypothetical protein
MTETPVGRPLFDGAEERPKRPILCIDFDGVLHSYRSGWKGDDQIPDPPVPGFAQFLEGAVEHFTVTVFGSRSRRAEGREAMRTWLERALNDHYFAQDISAAAAARAVRALMEEIRFPADKPAAFVSLDDRAVTFTGQWPDPAELVQFRTWQQPGA